jgi:hypothetical protein
VWWKPTPVAITVGLGDFSFVYALPGTFPPPTTAFAPCQRGNLLRCDREFDTRQRTPREHQSRTSATTWSASAFPLKTRATSSDRDRVAKQLRTCLQNMAAAGLTITYGALARLLELPPPIIHQLTVALERLMEEDAEAGRPFIAALVVSKARGGLPAVGFFDCARRLGRFAGDPNGVEARTFHVTELNAALKFWGV